MTERIGFMKAGVSVIIAAWNAAETIEQTILSALNQTHAPLEVLVCDDGSSDGTREIIEAIDDSRVRWIDGGRSGRPAVPRNRGIAQSAGEWIAMLDSDDQWLREKLAAQLALAGKMDCRAVSTNAVRFVPAKGAAGNLLSWSKERITFNDLLDINQVVCSSALIHRSAFKIARGFPEAPALKSIEDYACWLRVATQTDFAYIAEPLVIYRDNPVNSVRSADVTLWSQRRLVFTDFLEWTTAQQQPDKVEGFERQVKRELARDYWRRHASNIRRIKQKIKSLAVFK